MMQSLPKIITAALALAAAAALLRLVNLRRENRGRQFLSACLSPILAAAASVYAFVCFDQLQLGEDSYFTGGEVLVWNLLIVAAFLILKLLLCPVMSAVWSRQANMELTSDTWYEYDDEQKGWFLRERYRDLAAALKVLTAVVAALCAAVLAVGWCAGEGSPFRLRVFPCAALVVVAEVCNFLSGYTRTEYAHDVGGEDITSTGVGGYYKLRKVYEDLFPSALLVSHTGNEYAGKQGATELIAGLRKSGDPVDRVVGEYFSGLRKKDGFFDVDMITAASTLLHGHSAIIFNPFYRDLSDYLRLPMVNSLVNDRKCLIIVGRSTLREDVIRWVEDMLREYSHTRSLWRVAELDSGTPDCEVGVLSFSQLYDLKVMEVNAGFLGEADFVLLLEPSRMAATSQVGLGIVVEHLSKGDKPTYCICDRDVDGLLDTMSHVLQTDLTDAAAAPIPRSVYTGMGWSATGDFIRQRLFDKQTHYLGNGIELAAVALKNQVKHVTWYSAEKAPVQDIKWLAGQYYPQICKYAHLPNQQRSLDERITFTPNLWSSEARQEEFVIAEDEFCNLFATMRAYLTRGEEQSFVNVISESYLLRDYMRYNRQLFMSDPKAIPSLAPYYAKTERNTVCRLILMMAAGQVPEEYIAHELSLLGCSTEDVYSTLSRLISRYSGVEGTIVTVRSQQDPDVDLVPNVKAYYSIAPQIFDENFASTLKNAFFVVEDEKFGSELIDARLFEHITQTVMPGQFVTHSGKYYKVAAVSPEAGCILRRASASYSGRRYYRQLRTYTFGPAQETLRARRVMDVEVAAERRDFRVDTSGYLEMRDNHDLRTARLVDLSADPGISVYSRSCRNKTVLRLSLPESDPSIRFTVCMLMGELFRTLFPDAWPYLAVLCVRPVDVDGMLDKFAYHAGGELDETMVYVVEDSDMDLGLLEAVENNLTRIFEILADYLSWHFEKMREPPRQDPVIPAIVLPEEEQREKGFRARIGRWLARLAGREEVELPARPGRKEEQPPEEPATQPPEDQKPEQESPAGEPPEDGEREPALIQVADGAQAGLSEGYELEGASEDAAGGEEPPAPGEEAPPAPEPEDSDPLPEEMIILREDDEDLLDADGVPDDLDLVMPIPPSRYQKECYLKFGFDEIGAQLRIEDVSSYLNVRGWGDSALTKARKRTGLEDSFLDLGAENQCDFCGLPLTGVSFERLADGRTRCNDCSQTAINQVSEFRELFKRTEMMLENTFSIRIPVSIAVRTTDARTIAHRSGMVFRPSTKAVSRVLGFAQRKGGQYSLYIENGSPRLAAILTTAHELTHIWQYLNWKDNEIRSIYRQSKPAYTKLARDIVYEGMAVWSSIQLLYAMGETYYARQQEQLNAARQDIYGLGFCLYRDRYGLTTNGEAPGFSPFSSFPPLDPAEVKSLFPEEE